MTITNPLVARFQNREALVAAEHQAWFTSCLDQAGTQMSDLHARLLAGGERIDAGGDAWWGEPDSFLAYLRPYVVRDGVLQIPVKGVLLHDFPYAFGPWATGYDYIWRAFQRGMGDANVKGIALIVDSPGGMVAGCFEMVDKMFAMRGVKPIAGFASEAAYSAAYATISVVDPGRLYVTRTGGVGSIGVVTTHVDVSKAMDAAGYAITFIYAGAHKVDGNPYEALPAEVKARIQARIGALYEIFVSTVARNRGLDEQAVRNTEALTFSAPDALSNGLADEIGALDDALADFSASLTLNEGDETMADLTQADLDNAVAQATANHETALATARADAATAERARIGAILGSDEGASRPKAALATALKTNMDVETATAFLADMAAEAAPAAQTPSAGAPAGMLQAAMNGSPNPNITGEDGEEAAEGSRADRTFSLRGRSKRAPAA